MIAVVDLVEAEGRALRQSILRVGMGLGLAVLVVVLVAAAIGFCLWAIHQYLAGVMVPPAASLVTGLIALLVAGVLGWVVRRLGR